MRPLKVLCLTVVMALAIGLFGCGGGAESGGGGVPSNPESVKLWKGDFPNTLYRLNIYNEIAGKVAGKPWMAVKYNNITSKIIDIEFGLSEVTQEQIANPSNFPMVPEPTLAASAIDYHAELGLKSPVALLGTWGFKSAITSPNGTPIIINSDALFSFWTGSNYNSTHYVTKWTFSKTTGLMSGGAQNGDQVMYWGWVSDNNALHLHTF